MGFEGEGLELERVVNDGEADVSFAIGAIFCGCSNVKVYIC